MTGQEKYSHYILSFLFLSSYFLFFINNKVSFIFISAYLLVATFFLLKEKKHINNILIICVVAIVYFYVNTYLNIKVIGDLDVRYKYTERYAAFFVFPLIGYGFSLISDPEKKISFTLIIGLFVYLVFYTNPSDWVDAFQGKRVDFGIINAQHSANVFLFSVLVSILLIKHDKNLFWYAATVIFALLCIAGQVRAIWLGFVSTAIFLLINYLRNKIPKSLMVLIMISLAPILYCTYNYIDNKDADEIGRFSLASRDFKTLSEYLESKKVTPSSSVVRIVSWGKAYEWWLEKPFLGHGAGKVKALISDDIIFQKTFNNKFQHLHNTYLEVLVSYGIIGFLLYLLVVLSLIRKIYIKYSSCCDKSLFLLVGSYVTIWSVANFFESYILYSSGFYINSLLFGFLYYLAYFREIK